MDVQILRSRNGVHKRKGGNGSGEYVMPSWAYHGLTIPDFTMNVTGVTRDAAQANAARAEARFSSGTSADHRNTVECTISGR